MAVNDKDPTEAIQLVEQTIGTFHQIVVGQEGQMVPVPGHPDQPTLAERVKQNLKPSTDAAAGYAAQAREEATKAAREADRASQIAGLDTVAEAVGLAAIPFPDVWIPLSDSLRMLAGYGREVKVGDDVVANYATLTRNSAATMVNKSLSLAPVAINEARFERDGVLVESMSTNLMRNHGLCLLRSNQLALTPDSDGFFQMPTGDSLQFRDGVTLPWPPSEQCVLSVLVKGYGKFSLETSTYAAFVNGVSIVVDLDLVKVSDQSKGFILDVGGDVFLVGVYVTTASSPSTSTTKGLYVNQVDGNNNIKAGYCQLESGNDATSRILTVGSSVTRAADKLTIPRLNNYCAEWYSGPDQINPIVTADTIELYPPAGKAHLRNVRGFFTPLTPAQKAALK